MTTENRDYNVPEAGEEDWHVPVNENWEMIDDDMQAALDAAQAALDAATGGDGDAEPTSGGTGFSWDQTHVDTSWLDNADANDDLTVETVTNLDASGPGSLEAALGAAENNANTLIVFEVGGVIDNGGTTWMRSHGDNIYIAGQTAPYPGITLIRGGLRVHGNNTIIEHVSFLPGDDTDAPQNADAANADHNTRNVLFDHCTFGWGTDVTFVVHPGCSNIGVINSINAEALNHSSHPEAPHGYGFNVRGDSGPITYMGNLHLHNWKRNPRPNGGQIFLANNYYYNWGGRIIHGTDPGCELDWVEGVIEAGPDTDSTKSIFDGWPADVYWDGMDLIPSDTSMGDRNVTYHDSPLNQPPGLDLGDLVSPNELDDYLTARAGARPADRAPHEQRIVNNFADRQGRIIDHHNDVGGYPSYPSNSRSLDPPSTGLLGWIEGHTGVVESGE